MSTLGNILALFANFQVFRTPDCLKGCLGLMFVHSPRFCLQSVVNSFNVIAPLNLIVPGLKRMIRSGQVVFELGSTRFLLVPLQTE